MHGVGRVNGNGTLGMINNGKWVNIDVKWLINTM